MMCTHSFYSLSLAWSTVLQEAGSSSHRERNLGFTVSLVSLGNPRRFLAVVSGSGQAIHWRIGKHVGWVGSYRGMTWALPLGPHAPAFPTNTGWKDHLLLLPHVNASSPQSRSVHPSPTLLSFPIPSLLSQISGERKTIWGSWENHGLPGLRVQKAPYSAASQF